MGGDDLGSDDEFLTGQVVDEHDKFDFEDDKKKKTKSALAASTVAVELDEDDNDKKRKTTEDDTSPATNKKSKPSRHKLLLTAGRAMEQESTEHQATFLGTSIKHYTQLQAGKEGNDNSDSDEEDTSSFKLQPHHFIKDVPKGVGFELRLRHCLPSMKLLKTHKHRQSPLCIVVCSSARRAVEILKDIKAFKIRAAKLFAKHLTVEEQTMWLQETPFGIAVGTPHRLTVLCQANALKLNQTRLVVLDAHANPKGFTVCTLPDTAKDCMEFLRTSVLPAIKERPKLLKLAFC